MTIQSTAMQTRPLAIPSLVKEISFDRQSLSACYERYNGELFRYAYRLLGDSATAEDCVSETFYRFLKAVRDGLGPLENTRAYLYRVARNWITDYFRSQPLRMTSLDIELDGDGESNPSRLAAEKWERERVRAAVRSLPPDQQQVIMLRFMEDWSHEDVATALGRSIEATRTLQHRALTSLRQYLQLDEAGFTSFRQGRQKKPPAAAPAESARLTNHPTPQR
jgi:RNA polymerase sigma-70 factor (ECF subfamily)